MGTLSRADFFELGKKHLDQFITECANYGLQTDPPLTLRPATGLLCYYDLKDGQIYFSAPSVETPVAQFRTNMLAALLGCSGEELLDFFALFIPRVIAHELGHYFRHRDGLFGTNLWYEEQVANQLASALAKRRLSPANKEFCLRFLRQAIHNLAQQFKSDHDSVLSYDNMLDALNVLGYLGEADEEAIQTLGKLFAVSGEQILKANRPLAASLRDELGQRAQGIETFNDAYISDLLQYMYTQMSWTYVDLISQREHYVDEFARDHLQRQPPLLPNIQTQVPPKAREIQACYQAAIDVQSYSPVAAIYFDKRYRALLLRGLEGSKKSDGTPWLTRQTVAYLENWNQQDTDELDYVTQLVPRPLRDLAPSQIKAHLDPTLDVQKDLPSETDRRLWRHVIHREADAGAANTLARLQALESSCLFRNLPAEAMLELVHNYCRVLLAPGETLLWKGDRDNAIYIILKGQVEVLLTESEDAAPVTTLGPGNLVGELGFITRAPRAATVRAKSQIECLVIHDADLQILSVTYPSILIQIADELAHSVHKQTH